MRTVLTEMLSAAGVRIGEYRGAETEATFGEPRAEFQALRTSGGIFDLGWRAKLAATGEDCVRWLNGMVTNNVRDLALGRGVYSFLLNAQGRILADLYCYNRGEYLLLDTDAAQIAKLRETLEKFIIMDDVELADLTDKLTAIGVAGPKAEEVLQQSGIFSGELQPLEVQDVVWRALGLSVTRTDDEVVAGFEVWMAPGNATVVWEALRSTGATPVGFEALEMMRVFAGRPRYGQDISERYLPQETEQYRALHFTKGCYLGQEIVERIRSRGQVHRVFTGFVVEGEAQPGTKIRAGEKDVGEITSVARVPANGGEQTLALGYARREVAQPGAALEIGGARAVVAQLPFTKVFASVS